MKAGSKSVTFVVVRKIYTPTTAEVLQRVLGFDTQSGFPNARRVIRRCRYELLGAARQKFRLSDATLMLKYWFNQLLPVDIPNSQLAAIATRYDLTAIGIKIDGKYRGVVLQRLVANLFRSTIK